MAINQALIKIAESYAPKWGIAAEGTRNKPLFGSRRVTQQAKFSNFR